VARAPLPHLVALLCGVLAALAVGCGDRSNLIPQSRADDLTQQLADIKAAVDQGECAGITQKVRSFRSGATSLSSSVDKDLRVRLRQGADALLAHAADDCATNAAGQTQTQTTDTTTTDTSTETTPAETTTTTETTTVPPDTTTTETTTTTPDTTTTGTTPVTPPTDTGTAPETGGVITPDDGATP
jgi:hypothetical protein